MGCPLGPRCANPRNKVRSGVPIPGGCCGSAGALLVQPGCRRALSGRSREQPESQGLLVSGACLWVASASGAAWPGAPSCPRLGAVGRARFFFESGLLEMNFLRPRLLFIKRAIQCNRPLFRSVSFFFTGNETPKISHK